MDRWRPEKSLPQPPSRLFVALLGFVFYFFIEFIELTLVKKLHRFQVYSSITCHLYILLYYVTITIDSQSVRSPWQDECRLGWIL